MGLQQRLLSSIAAFVHTLKVHRASLAALAANKIVARESQAALAFVTASDSDATAELGLEDAEADAALDADEEAAADAASRAGAIGATRTALEAELLPSTRSAAHSPSPTRRSPTHACAGSSTGSGPTCWWERPGTAGG